MPTKSFCLFSQNLNNISNFIFHQSYANLLGIQSYNLSLLSVITKLLLCKLIINLVKDTLYNALF